MLLEAPFDPLRRNKNSVLLTVDLTKAVADEAIERNASIVVAYRRCPLDDTPHKQSLTKLKRRSHYL